MSIKQRKSGSHKTVAVAEDNKAKALLQVRDAADEFLDRIFTMSSELGISSEEGMDAAQEILEGVNIPEEETEEIWKRAKKEGKTFVHVFPNSSNRGLPLAPATLRSSKSTRKIWASR